MRLVSRWNQWRKCHSKDWVSHKWRDEYVVDGEKLGVNSRDEGKHTGRNNLLFMTDYMDSLDCLLLLLSISVFYFLVFLFYTFSCWFRAVD